MDSRITELITTLPDAPGVYIMKGHTGEVIYVGKAKSLRDRVRSYFSGADTRAFVALLDHVLADLEVILTHSDKEAILLENELIKAHQPRFNVKLTDDKRFLCLRLDLRQSYPRLEVVRRFRKDGARYFGPYHSASAIRATLRLVNRHFQLRTCSDQVLTSRTRPCLQYQIKRCPGPCVFDLAQGVYAQNVASVVTFLEGRTHELVTALSARMRERAAALDFEAAVVLRDQIHAVTRSLERQRLVTDSPTHRDIVGLYREGPAIEVHVMRSRAGSLVDARRFTFADTEVPTSEVLADFAGRFYTDATDTPDEILFPVEMEWADALATVLSEKRGRSVAVLTPKRGDKHALVELACKNAHQAFIDKQREAGAARTAIERLQRVLHLRHLPERLECFDISHLQGKQIVASAVRFERGVARKDLYRHYKIRSTVGQDDFKSMYEVVSRRVRRGLEEGDLPDLMVIDGGKGQLGAAHAALDDHGVDTVDLIGLAKSRLLDDADAAAGVSWAAAAGHPSATQEGTAEEDINIDAADDMGDSDDDPGADEPILGEAPRSPERVFVFGQKNPIVLRQNSAELFMLTRARDEAHRFAITFHRKLRQKAGTRSALDNIAGVGPKRRRALLKKFGSVSRIKEASESEIAQVVGHKLALVLMQALSGTPPDVGT